MDTQVRRNFRLQDTRFPDGHPNSLPTHHLSLTHRPGMLDGTFTVVAQTLLADVIAEGPIRVVAYIEDPAPGSRHCLRYEGIAVAPAAHFDPPTLRFEDGTTISIEDLV